MSKKIVILGAGESGVGAALLAQKKGYDVWVSDGGMIRSNYKLELQQHNIPFEEGAHTWSKIDEAACIIKSPGIRASTKVVQYCIEKQIPLLDEIEFAFQYKEKSKIISVTGSNGKTTTASLIYHIIKEEYDDVALVGNIGNSFAKAVALNPKPVYVVEVSSFQLDYTSSFNSEIVVLTNITPDHLDEYNYQFEHYIKSKFKIIQNQTHDDYCIYNDDDSIIHKYIKEYPIKSIKIPFSMKERKDVNHASIINKHISIHIKEKKMNIPISSMSLIGKHNEYNATAAATATSALGIRKETIQKALASFQAVDHRMEYLGTFQGVMFINDSKATNVNSTWYALESMTRPVVLLMGGKDKGNDYSDILDLVKNKVKAIICIGVDNQKIVETFTDHVEKIVETTSMSNAVHSAFHLASQGDVVLLSPACASFDLFKNYEDRGNQFKQAVSNL